MKSKAVVFFILTFFPQAIIPATLLAADGNIKWHAYKEGMSQGKNKQKKVFLHFWAKWCPSCKKMEKETFKDASVIAYLNKNFISIRVDTDRERALSSEYGIRGVPDNWFISEDGETISNLPGYIPVKLFLPLLKYIRTNSYKKMNFSKFMKEN